MERDEQTPNQITEEQLKQWFNLVYGVLDQQFPDYEVGGQLGQHPSYGYMFAFQLKREENAYECAFFLEELARQFQQSSDPARWLASFYYDKMQEGSSSRFPEAPTNEEEAKKVVDERIVPHCAKSIREEFSEPVHVDLELHPDHGPVLEAGFPSIKEGTNTCALPISYLYALYQMNRDPAEPMINALYRIIEEQRG